MAKCFTIINYTKLFTDVLKAYAKDEYNREFLLGYDLENKSADEREYYVIVRGIAMFFVHERNLLLDLKAFPHLHAVENREEKRGEVVHFIDTAKILKGVENSSFCEYTETLKTVDKKVYRVFKAGKSEVLIEKAMCDYIAQPDLLRYNLHPCGAILGIDNNGTVEFFALPLRAKTKEE